MFRTAIITSALLIPGSALAASPAHFMTDAIQGDYSEITLGKLIAHRGSSARVRDFGATLVRDHSNGLAQAQEVARRLRLNIRPSMAPGARTELTKLRHLRGLAFDREVKRFMIHDHEKAIAEFKAQAHSGNRQTSHFAAATVPVLQKHLAIARSIRA
ncbi:MAG: DUF4142 domain-containing protein [Terriglobales bacterium]